MISICLNSLFSFTIDTNLKVGDTYVYKDNKLMFNNVVGKIGSNYTSLVGNFNLTDSKNNNVYLSPEIRIYSSPKMITSEANIKSNFFYDTFITMSNIQNSDFYNIRFQKKPFMIWIWISAMLISLGGFVSVFKKKN